MGVVYYANDRILLSPSRHAAQIMLSKCEQFCLENNIQFSTHEDASKSKSKAIYTVGLKRAGVPRPKNSSCAGGPSPGWNGQTNLATLYTRTG